MTFAGQGFVWVSTAICAFKLFCYCLVLSCGGAAAGGTDRRLMFLAGGTTESRSGRSGQSSFKVASQVRPMLRGLHPFFSETCGDLLFFIFFPSFSVSSFFFFLFFPRISFFFFRFGSVCCSAGRLHRACGCGGGGSRPPDMILHDTTI